MTRRAYTVVWEPELLDDFAQRWIASDAEHRALLTHVADLIDKTLASAPESVGRPWRDGLIWAPTDLTPTVGVYFEISPDDRTVNVLRIYVSHEEA